MIMRFKKNSEITNTELWDMQDTMTERAGQAVTYAKDLARRPDVSDREKQYAARQAERAVAGLTAVNAEVDRRFG